MFRKFSGFMPLMVSLRNELIEFIEHLISHPTFLRDDEAGGIADEENRHRQDRLGVEAAEMLLALQVIGLAGDAMSASDHLAEPLEGVWGAGHLLAQMRAELYLNPNAA